MIKSLILSALLCATAIPAAAQSAKTDYRSRLPQDEVIYFVLPDRFENADPSNDRGGIAGDRLKTGYDPTAKGFYHGGDLKGLTRRLDYIQHLGATAICSGRSSRTRRCRVRRATSPLAITDTGSPTSRRSTRISAPTPT